MIGVFPLFAVQLGSDVCHLADAHPTASISRQHNQVVSWCFFSLIFAKSTLHSMCEVMTKTKQTKCVTRLAETRQTIKTNKMEAQKLKDKTQLMLMLQYSIERYQAMGNGIKCQELRSELNALRQSMEQK